MNIPQWDTPNSCEPDRWLLLQSPKRPPKTDHLSWGLLPLHRHTDSASHTKHRGVPDSRANDCRVPSCGFSPPRRLAPQIRARACCIPLPVMGFTCFPASAERSVARGSSVPSRRCHHPPKKSTFDSRTASPRPFPPRRCPPATTEVVSPGLDLEVLLHRMFRTVPARLPSLTGPLLPGLSSPPRLLSHRCPHPSSEDADCGDTSLCRARCRVAAASRPKLTSTREGLLAPWASPSRRPKTMRETWPAPVPDDPPAACSPSTRRSTARAARSVQ
jgi:hypothetical protein